MTSFTPTTGCFGSHSRDGGDNSRAFQSARRKNSQHLTEIKRYSERFSIRWSQCSPGVPVRTRPLSRSARADSYVSVVSPTISGAKNFTYETASGVLRLARVISGLGETLNRNAGSRAEGNCALARRQDAT